MSNGYVDADGHVMEKAEKLIQYLEEPWRSLEPVIPRRLLPSGDEFHTPRMRRKGIFIEAVGPEDWLEYLEKTGLEFTFKRRGNGGVSKRSHGSTPGSYRPNEKTL